MAHYEGRRLGIAAALLPALIEALESAVEELLEEAPKAAKSKRGPTSTLERQIEQISQLPRAKQKFVMEMLDTVIHQASQGEFIMQSVKQIIHDIADHLPEQATLDDAMYALYVRQKLEEGLRDLDEGRTYTQEEVEQHLLGKRPS